MNQELKYYMNLSYRMEIVEDKDEGGYVLSYPDLPGCMTCSDSLDDLLELAKDARDMDFRYVRRWERDSAS